MTTPARLSDSARGYLSEESKRRFTILAGVLGAVFFVAQTVLPFVLFLGIMLPTMVLQDVTSADLDRAVVWRGELWYVERVHEINWKAPEESETTLRLRHARLDDLEQAEDAVLVGRGPSLRTPTLVTEGDRLWLVGDQQVSFFENGALTRLAEVRRPARASAAFMYRGHLAMARLGRSPDLLTLRVDGTGAEWQSEPLEVGPPPDEETWFAEVKPLPVGERLFLFAEACSDESEARSLLYREVGESEWRALTTDTCCSSWTPLLLGGQVAVAFVEQPNRGPVRLSLMVMDRQGAIQRQEIGPIEGLSRWGLRALSTGTSVVLVGGGMSGGRSLAEIEDGKVVRTARVKGSFPPFGGAMMALMMVPQTLPLLLGLALALVLTRLMRKHRVGTYAAGGAERAFATLWQRAWAQVVDAVVLGAGLMAAAGWMWSRFSDPERLLDLSGRWFPLVFIGLFAAGFAWLLLMVVVFSYLEGRYGKTPGKWLLGIRVLGTDLAPCGFWRALVRNLLTFVDGFFSFLVGILLVALTENWQRLGDLAARTLVVADAKVEPAPTPV